MNEPANQRRRITGRRVAYRVAEGISDRRTLLLAIQAVAFVATIALGVQAKDAAEWAGITGFPAIIVGGTLAYLPMVVTAHAYLRHAEHKPAKVATATASLAYLALIASLIFGHLTWYSLVPADQPSIIASAVGAGLALIVQLGGIRFVGVRTAPGGAAR